MNNHSAPDSGFLLANLMDTLTDAIYFKDRESRFIMINKACALKHRWASMEMISGKTDFDVFSREHAEQAFADEQQIIETGKPLYGVIEKETFADGSVAWVSTTKMPLMDAGGGIIGTFGISRDITKHKEAELRSQRYSEEIRRRKEEMEEDVKMAGELQKAFFPRNYPIFPKGASKGEESVEFLHQFSSCSDVGGDYCSIQQLSETQVSFFLCDVQGVGLRAALGTALIRGIVQELSPLKLEPGAYLERVNQLLVPLLGQSEVPMDVLAFYMVLDVNTGKIRYASAGHPRPMLLKNEGRSGWLPSCEPERAALAVRMGTCYRTCDYMVEPGDTIVLYTNGLLSVPNANRECYGEERLLASSQRHSDQPLKALFRLLESDAEDFSADGTFTDDICLVGFRLNRLSE